MQETTTNIKRDNREVSNMTLNTFLQDLIIKGEDEDEELFGSGDNDDAHDLGSSKRSLPLTLDIVDDNARLTADQVQTIRTCRSFSGYEMALRKQHLHQGKGNSRWDTTGDGQSRMNDTSSSSESDNLTSTFASGNRTGSFDSALNMPARRESIEVKSALSALNLMGGIGDDELDDDDSDMEEAVPSPHGSILKSVDSASLMRNVIMHHDHDSSSNIGHNATFGSDQESSLLVASKAARDETESNTSVKPSRQRTPSFLELCQQAAQDHLGSSTATASRNSQFSEEELAAVLALNNPSGQQEEIQQKQQQRQQIQQQQRAPSFLELCQQAAQDHLNSADTTIGASQNAEFSEEEQLAAALALNNSAPEKQEVRQPPAQRTPSFMELCQQAAQDHVSHASTTIAASQNSEFADEEQLAAALALNSSNPPQQQQRTPSFLELCAQSARDHVRNTTSTLDAEPSARHNYVEPPVQADQLEQRIPSFTELCAQSAEDHIGQQTRSTMRNEAITINMSDDSASHAARPHQQAADHITSASGKVSLTPAMLKALRASGALSQKPGGPAGGFMGKNAPSSLKNAMLMASSNSSGNIGGLGSTKSFPPPGAIRNIGGRGASLSSMSDHGTASMYGSMPPRPASRSDIHSGLSGSMMSAHAAQYTQANRQGAYSSNPALQNAMLAAGNAVPMTPTAQSQFYGGRMGSGTSSSPSLKDAMLSANAAAAMMTSPKGSMGSRGSSNPALRNAMLSASTASDYQMQMLLEQQRQQRNISNHGIPKNAYDRSSFERSSEASASVFTTPYEGNKASMPSKKGTHVDVSETITRVHRRSRASREEEEEARGRAARKTGLSPSRWSAIPPSVNNTNITHSCSCDSFLTIPNRLESPTSIAKPSLSASTSARTKVRGVRRAKSGSDADRGTVRKPLRRRLKKNLSDKSLKSKAIHNESSGGGASASNPLKERPLLGRVRVIGDPSLHRSFRRSRRHASTKDDSESQAGKEKHQEPSRWSRSGSCDSFLKRPNRQLSPGNKKSSLNVKTVRDDIEELRKSKNDGIRVTKPSRGPSLPEVAISSLHPNQQSGSPSIVVDECHCTSDSRWSSAASMERCGSFDSFLKPPDRPTSFVKLPRPPVRKRGSRPQKYIKKCDSDPSLMTKTIDRPNDSKQQEDVRWSASHTPTHSGSCDSFLKRPIRQTSVKKGNDAKRDNDDSNDGSGNAQWPTNAKVKRKGNTLIVPLGCDINKVLALQRPSDNGPTLGPSRSSPSLGKAQRQASTATDTSSSKKSIRAALGDMAPPSKKSSSPIPRRGPGGDLKRAQSSSRRRIRTMRSLGELDPIAETGSPRLLDETKKSRSFGDFKLARQKSKRVRKKAKVEMARSRRGNDTSKEGGVGGSDNSLDMSSHKKKNRKGGRPSEKEQETAEQNAHW